MMDIRDGQLCIKLHYRFGAEPDWESIETQLTCKLIPDLVTRYYIALDEARAKTGINQGTWVSMEISVPCGPPMVAITSGTEDS